MSRFPRQSAPEHAEPATSSPQSRRRRRWLVVGAPLTALVVAGVAVLATRPFHSGETVDNETRTSLATVEQRSLSSQTQVSGTLGYAGDFDVLNQAKGTITKLPSIGDVVKAGEILYRVNNSPVVLLYGSTTAYRDLAAGATDITDLELRVAQAEAAMANAKLALQNAQDDLHALKDGPSNQEIAKAQSQVYSATMAVGDSQEDLKLAKKNWDAKVKAAQEAADAAADAYAKSFRKWLDITLSIEELSKDPDSLLASWKADLAAIFARVKRLTEAGEEFPADDPATRWNEAVTFSWLKFYPGQILATCDDGRVPYMGACIKKEMTDAWEAYRRANDNLATVQLEAARAIRNDETAVTQAQDRLTFAQKALDDLKAPRDPLNLDAKQKQVDVAEAALAKAGKDLDKTKGELKSAAASVRGPDVQQLNANLVALRYATPSDLDPNSDEFTRSTAQALKRLQAALGVEQTGALALGQAVFLPSAGRVTAVLSTPGVSVQPGTTVLEATSITPIVTVKLDPARQTQVKQGDSVTIRLPNLRTTPGTVSSVGTVAIPSSSGGQAGARDTTIPVEITLTDPAAVGGLDQAHVLVSIATATVDNALVVPVTALLALAGGGYAIELVESDGGHRLLPVTLGIFDDSAGRVQVTGAGLAAGQQVVVPGG